MGLFSKKEENKSMPPSVPPAPPAPGTDMAAPSNEISEIGNLVAPPAPGESSLNDIKNEVTGNGSPQNNLSMTDNVPATIEEKIPENGNNIDDSLFDLSDLDLGEPINSTEGNVEQQLGMNEFKPFEDSTIDTNLEKEGDLRFVKDKRGTHKNETFYITTSQFKALVEIIENVKNKVKDSSEVHLRLMDIKSEEDIEYENLRKTFQYIEDKLYEVDSLIFDK